MMIREDGVNPEVTPESGLTTLPTGRRYGGLDSDQRQRQRRERLITAALAVFGEHGFHHSTVRDVCQRAALTSRYFYESFEGMEVLFEAVYVDVSRALMRQTMLALQQAPNAPEALAEAALRTFLTFIQEDPHRARVALIDVQSIGPGMRRISQASSQDFATVIGHFLTLHFPNLTAVGLDAGMLAHGLVGCTTRMAAFWVEDQCRAPLEAVLRNMLAIFAATIGYARAASIKTPPGAP